MNDFIKNFSEVSQHNIGEVGEKGANLAALTAAGFSVPPGFCITTQAYQEFLQYSRLEEHIASKIAGADLSVLENVQTCGAAVRQLIMEHKIPDGMKEAILSAYWRLFTLTPRGKLYVAVRSSATAEDLPDISFAGQHDTYLNIFGQSDLLFSIKKCWASLWSDRAIAYRHKNNIDHTKVLMAVVIQQMVPSFVSGIMFTAHPVTNDTNELVISANWGLGETVVSGEVTPDEYIVEKESLAIKEKTIAEKIMMVTLGKKGAVDIPVPSEQQTQACLSERHLQELAVIGKKIEDHFNSPQDIEWGLIGEQFFILQSHHITTLQKTPGSTSQPSIDNPFDLAQDRHQLSIIWGNQTNMKELNTQIRPVYMRLFGYRAI